MEREVLSPSRQTEKLFLWASFILLLAVVAILYSTYGDDMDRLEGLRATERQKEKAYASLELTREQTGRYIDRFGRDNEFVRDQARERLGIAEPGEIVIRLDGAVPRSASSGNTPATR